MFFLILFIKIIVMPHCNGDHVIRILLGKLKA